MHLALHDPLASELQDQKRGGEAPFADLGKPYLQGQQRQLLPLRIGAVRGLRKSDACTN
jgi:hypothetical protein